MCNFSVLPLVFFEIRVEIGSIITIKDFTSLRFTNLIRYIQSTLSRLSDLLPMICYFSLSNVGAWRTETLSDLRVSLTG